MSSALRYAHLVGRYVRIERPAAADELADRSPELVGMQGLIVQVADSQDLEHPEAVSVMSDDGLGFAIYPDDNWSFTIWPDEETFYRLNPSQRPARGPHSALPGLNDREKSRDMIDRARQVLGDTVGWDDEYARVEALKILRGSGTPRDEPVGDIVNGYALAVLFQPSGKYYTEEQWRIPKGALGPYDMGRSPDFHRISGGPVLVPSQEPWASRSCCYRESFRNTVVESSRSCTQRLTWSWRCSARSASPG
jgi:hypothetical protein